MLHIPGRCCLGIGYIEGEVFEFHGLWLCEKVSDRSLGPWARVLKDVVAGVC